MRKGSHLEQATFSGHFSRIVENRNMNVSGMGKSIIIKIKVLYGEVQSQDNSKWMFFSILERILCKWLDLFISQIHIENLHYVLLNFLV